MARAFSVRQGGRRRRVVALAAAVLVVVVGAASAIGSVRGFILDQGFIGLPPQGATPSTPESGELVLRWLGRSETLEGHPSFASGCTPTAESSGARPRAGAARFPRARTSSPPATSSDDSRLRASSSCGRKSSDSSKAVALHSRRSRPTTIPVGGFRRGSARRRPARPPPRAI